MSASPDLKSKTVAVLHLGEMGAALAGVLRANGHRVVTHVEGCSDATARRAADGGCDLLPARDVFAAANVVISCVPPDAAMAVADAFCASDVRRETLFVDANSISPDLAATLARRVQSGGRPFVDAAINGLAENLATSATLFLSGALAADIAALFASAVKVQLLGDEPGRASAMKMLLAGVSKGVCSLYSELLLLADAHHLVPEFAAATRTIYPSIAALGDRMLPTYAMHATRRAAEMAELEATVASAGVSAPVLVAVREHHAALASHLRRHPIRPKVAFADYVAHLVDTRFKADVIDAGRPIASSHANVGEPHGQ